MSFAYALFVERETKIGIGCALPESFVLFGARFMSDVRSGLTANRACGVRVSFQVEVPGWIVRLSPVRGYERKGMGVALIADAKQGKGSRQSTLGASGCQEYHRQAS